MKSTPYSSINTHEIKTSALTRKSFSIFTRLNLQSRSHTDRSMPSGMLESLSRSWMAASSDDLAWACCLAVDGRSAKGLKNKEYFSFYYAWNSPNNEHQSSGPRSVKLCSDQYIFQFLFRTTFVYKDKLKNLIAFLLFVKIGINWSKSNSWKGPGSSMS
jgi:hypothetical protein